MKLQVLGINGGNGVILHPFKDDLIANYEPRPVFKTPGNIQWGLNFDTPLINEAKIPSAYPKKFKPDVIIGAPDCGHSSVLSFSRAKKLGNPNENLSLNLYLDAIASFEPVFFLMENLPKLLQNWGKDIYKVFPQYNLLIIERSVSAWGNSQVSRVRLVVVGVHKDFEYEVDDIFRLPKKAKLLTSGELIKGLKIEDPEICNVREPLCQKICLYYKKERSITALQAQDLWMHQFHNEKRWPVNMPRMKNQPGVYRNFAQDYPLTVRKQNRQFNHRGLMLTPREIARIQGIPDDFKLWYDKSKGNYSINKARVTCAKTPPYEIGQWFYNKLTDL